MSIFGDILPLNKNEEKANQASGASLSPYLNFDPHYIPKMQPEFIYPDDSHMATTARRSNVALPIIGMSFMTGSGLGGMTGLYKGLRATTLAGQTGKIRRTQVVNYIMKQGQNPYVFKYQHNNMFYRNTSFESKEPDSLGVPPNTIGEKRLTKRLPLCTLRQVEPFSGAIIGTSDGTTTGCTLGIIASFYSCIALGVTWLRDKEDTGNTFIAAATTGLIYKSTAGLKSMGLGAAVGLTLAGVYTLVTDNDNIWSKARYNRL